MATAQSSDNPGAQGAAAPPFDDVYLQHRRRVFAICLNSLGNADDAEDATQETFVKAAPHLAHFEGNVGAYLSVVARNVCCDEVRRRALQRRAAGELGRRGGREEIESRAVDRSVLSRLLPRLTRGERELLMHSFAGYSYDEIADRTGSPVGTVRVRLARARKRARGLASGLAGVLLVPAWRLLHHAAQRAVKAPGAALGAAADQVGLASGAVVTSLLAAAVAGSGFGQGALPVAARSGHGTAPGVAAVPGAQPASGSAPLAGGATVVAAGGRGPGPARAATAPAKPPAPGAETQTWVEGYATAPNSGDSASQPGPIFAWGHTGAGELLFRSDDGGHTWHQLAARGLVAGQVLVPPSFPADPTLFAMTASQGLLVSRDGGAGWGAAGATVAPGSSPAAAAVMAAPDGHPRVAFDTGQRQIGVYDAVSRTVTTLALPTATTNVVGLAAAGSELLASVREVPIASFSTDSSTVPAILACPAGASGCARPSGQQAPHWSGADLELLPVVGAPGTVALVDGPGAAYTTANGAAFSALAPSGLTGGLGAAAARMVGGVVTLVLQAFDASSGGPAQAVLLTPGGRAALPSLPNTEASAFLLLPGATLLGGGLDLDAASHPGVRCSHDAGGHWTSAC